MSKKALIVWGGWDGHEPKQIGEICEKELSKRDFEVEVSNSLDAYKDEEKLKGLDLIVPIWTMGKIEGDQVKPLMAAVESGVGIAGCHGGMCDSFRNEVGYQFMTGGQWVSHPGGDKVKYMVVIEDESHFITQGTPKEFEVVSEQYYLHVDPANKVLATTEFPVADGPHAANGRCKVPQIWTRMWGKGRVYYNALGHIAKTFAEPDILRLMVRGFCWAAHAEDLAD